VTSRVIDEEVERILREQEARALRLLGEHRQGLTLVAHALLEKETIGGAEVGRLVDEAYGRPVHEDRQIVPSFADPKPNGRPDPEAAPGEAPMPPATIPSTNWRAGTAGPDAG
jgi:ATP-dependent Zn protease